MWSTSQTLAWSHGTFLQFFQCTLGPFGLRFLVQELNKDWVPRRDAGRLPIGWCIYHPLLLGISGYTNNFYLNSYTIYIISTTKNNDEGTTATSTWTLVWFVTFVTTFRIRLDNKAMKLESLPKWWKFRGKNIQSLVAREFSTCKNVL